VDVNLEVGQEKGAKQKQKYAWVHLRTMMNYSLGTLSFK